MIILNHPGQISAGYAPVLDCHTAHVGHEPWKTHVCGELLRFPTSGEVLICRPVSSCNDGYWGKKRERDLTRSVYFLNPAQGGLQCGICGRLWQWEGSNVWKRKPPPLARSPSLHRRHKRAFTNIVMLCSIFR